MLEVIAAESEDDEVRQPVRKSEGWAAYRANRAVIRADADYGLGDRIGRLLDDTYRGGRQGMASRAFRSRGAADAPKGGTPGPPRPFHGTSAQPP